LVDGVDLVDLGEHRLRDLAAPTRLFQVRAVGLAVSFPPLHTLDRVPGNLPVMATSFIGRDQELKKLVELVREHRLVTLTGVGGVGKTRLAVQVSAELVLDFSDGVWLVELAALAEPDAVPEVVATALGVTARTGTVTDSIVNALAGRRLLLVVDNCEHVLDVVAPLLAAIVAATSSVTVLASSREALGVAGEHRWPVPPFTVDEGARSPAVELFTERARAQDPEFQVDADAATVVEICRRVDGIALAIELAAARMVSMTPQDLIECLDDRFRVLSGTPRGGGRHQTLIQSVQWSLARPQVFDQLGQVDDRAPRGRFVVMPARVAATSGRSRRSNRVASVAIVPRTLATCPARWSVAIVSSRSAIARSASPWRASRPAVSRTTSDSMKRNG
jgi:hypothetical protein